jgi:dihydroorotase
MKPNIHIQQGKVVDPANQLDTVTSVYVSDGKVVAVGDTPPAGFVADEVIDARGKVVCPGFIDLSSRLREPGQTRKATIASEVRAAASAGVTSLCVHPDTVPVVDTPAIAELIRELAKATGFPQVL